MDDPNTRGSSALAIMGVFVTLAGIVVALRLYTRFIMLRNPGPEDYTIIVSLMCSIGCTIGNAYMVKYGMGKHFNDVPKSDLKPLNLSLWIDIHFYSLTLAFTKISIVLQLLRIFTGGVLRRVCWVSLGVMIVYLFWTFFSVVFSCYPIAFFWDKTLDGDCSQQVAFWYSNPSLNLVTDIWLLLLPIPAIRALQLPRRQKLGLFLVFMLGGIVTVISIVRLPSLAYLLNSHDPTYDNIPIAIYSSVESNVGIICASGPVLKPMIVRFFPGLLSTNGSSAKPHGSYALERTSRYNTTATRKSRASMPNNYGVESSAWRGYPMERVESIDSEGDKGRESGIQGPEGKIQVTTTTTMTVAHAAYNKEDGASLTDSERKLVQKPEMKI